MLYAIICTDKPDGLPLRQETRPKHLDYLQGLADTLKIAGPFLSEEAQTPNGSMLVVDVASLDEARAIAEGDPYAKAGLFESVEFRPWTWTVGNPEGA
ncbi:MAG: YciI family protein [Hyphomicrobiales bacterium]|nr:YciI family protein [Hyphomicrobiales bacterium]